MGGTLLGMRRTVCDLAAEKKLQHNKKIEQIFFINIISAKILPFIICMND
jgi:hypothetical protein